MSLDSEISIPHNKLDPLFGGSYWKEADDATLEEINLHIHLLQAHAAAELGKANNWIRVVQAAAQYSFGNQQLTLGQLRIIARKAHGEGAA